MKYITLYACLLAFCVALAATWRPQPRAMQDALRKERSPSYSVKDFCRDHEDICKRGIRTVLQPTPTPSKKGYVVVIP